MLCPHCSSAPHPDSFPIGVLSWEEEIPGTGAAGLNHLLSSFSFFHRAEHTPWICRCAAHPDSPRAPRPAAIIPAALPHEAALCIRAQLNHDTEQHSSIPVCPMGTLLLQPTAELLPASTQLHARCALLSAHRVSSLTLLPQPCVTGRMVPHHSAVCHHGRAAQRMPCRSLFCLGAKAFLLAGCRQCLCMAHGCSSAQLAMQGRPPPQENQAEPAGRHVWNLEINST